MKFLLVLYCALLVAISAKAAEESLPIRGYYMTFMRMPAWGLPEWKQAVDCLAEDGANTLILWMAGGFRSAKYPITWSYNEEHQNVREDFARDLIDYAHTKKIRVLLGFTPYGYDGVNQIPIERPELKARKADGSPVDRFGIHCWGWSLCPSQEEARAFLLEYIREMAFEFYPNADGLMIESSDYDICRCEACAKEPYQREYAFVRQISEEVWKRNADAIIMVYPHYFSGRKVNPGTSIETETPRLELDPRWTLFFTPHSAHLDEDLVARAGSAVFWNEGLTLGTPALVRDGVRKARASKLSGYMPSLEPFSYLMPQAEFGAGAKGQRIIPLGFDWMKEGAMPLLELPARLMRLAFREYTRWPEMPEEEFRTRVGREFFGLGATPEKIEDLLFVQACVNHNRDWSWASPLVDPELFQAKSAREKWPQERIAEYHRRIERLEQIATRYAAAENGSEKEMQRIASFIVQRWEKFRKK